MAACPSPGLDGLVTNGDLVNRLLSYDEALALCNLDKEALRDWVVQVDKNNPKD